MYKMYKELSIKYYDIKQVDMKNIFFSCIICDSRATQTVEKNTTNLSKNLDRFQCDITYILSHVDDNYNYKYILTVIDCE